MSDNLRHRIAAVQSEHQARANSCLCGWKYDPITDDSHFDHVADTLIRELGLKKASRPNDYRFFRYPPGDRYITDWLADE